MPLEELSWLIGQKNNVIIHGRAGTGKSTLLRKLVQKYPNSVVLSPTGIAALNVGGQTIHSFFGLGLGYQNESDAKPCTKQAAVLKRKPLIIIDEISMVRSDIFCAIDLTLQKTFNNSSTFGGLQLILFGDTGQLPPVVTSSDIHLFPNNSAMFFMSKSYVDGNFQRIELNTVYRQNDVELIDVLSKIRKSTIQQHEIDGFNSRTKVLDAVSALDAKDCTILCMTNRIADGYNMLKYTRVESREFKYKATITGIFSEKEYPTQEDLALKVGCKVVMIRNDKEGRWVNGTIAVISRLTEEKVYVEIDDEIYEAMPETWEKYKYVPDNASGVRKEITGSFKQVPVKLAWAITVHKSQGMTLEKAHIELRDPPFEHGQLYVALSRIKSSEGLTMSRGIIYRDICVNPNYIIDRD